jgi:outer membrane receptor protein involved in Fe transport
MASYCWLSLLTSGEDKMKKSVLLIGTVITAICTDFPVFAQTNDNDAQDFEVINVTATKRSTALQEVPIAVSVVTADTIESAQIRDLLDLQTVVPSLRIGQGENLISTTFSIRGFGNGGSNPGIEPSVGVFIDGVYRPRGGAQIGDLSNINRVEVLHGPQSTLFGKNASAGVISVVTRAPQFDRSGSMSATYGNFNTVVLKGDFTGPISEDVAFSVSANYNNRDGYAQDLEQNTDINGRNRFGIRSQLLFEPSAELALRFIADYDEIDENCCVVANLVAGPTVPAIDYVSGGVGMITENPFAYTTRTNVEATNRLKNYGFSGHVEYEMHDLAFTSVSAYREFLSDSISDGDFSPADLIGDNTTVTDIKSFSQEFRVASDFDGPVNFLVGAFYYNEDLVHSDRNLLGTDARAYLDILSQGGLNSVEDILGLTRGTFEASGTGVTTHFDVKDETYSFFGTVDFSVTEQLTLTAGLNYTNDSKDVTANVLSTEPFSAVDLVGLGVAIGVPAEVANNPAYNPLLPLQGLQFQPPFLNFPNQVEDGKTRDDDLSYTVRAAFDFSDNVNIYASYATGFKATSWNLSNDSRPFSSDFIAGSSAALPSPPSSAIRDAGLALANLSSGTRFAGPESSKVYELGVKGNWRHGYVNFAVFDQSIEGFQSNAFTGTGFALTNAGEQSTFGVELDSKYSPTNALDLFFAVTYLDPIYDSFTGSIFGDLSGERPVGIPEISLSLGGSYRVELANGMELALRADYSYEDEVQLVRGFVGFGPDTEGAAIAAQNLTREVNMLNAAITLYLTNGIELSIYGRNLTDDEYLTGAADGVAQQGSVFGSPSAPRTYGATVRYKF